MARWQGPWWCLLTEDGSVLLLSPRLGLTSQPPMGTHETPLLCTISTPWGQTSTCRLSGLSARSSRTMTRKQPCPSASTPVLQMFPWLAEGLLGCMCLDFPSAKPGLNNTLLLKSSLGENYHRHGDTRGGEGKDRVSPLLPSPLLRGRVH